MNSTRELYRTRAIQLFIFSFILTTIAFAFIGVMFWNHYESSREITKQALEVENIEGNILLYDEILTMSARMYTSTANSMWEERYNQTVPLLDSALANAQAIAPQAFASAIEKTDKANQALIEKEIKAFELAKEGNTELAYSTVMDVSYQEYKKTYAEGMVELTQTMKGKVEVLQQKNEKRATLASTITLIIVPFLLFVWFNTLRLIRKYIVTQHNLREEIIGHNRQLEQKVSDRTAEIQEKNEELSASEEELRQNLEELQAIQDQLSIANQELSENFSALEDKNKVIAQKNLNITASINYAKRIQDAMLTKSEVVSKILPNSFIYFQPRDIVSGDFFYFNKVGNKLIIAAVDCTGHGVPGAFMSLIGNNLLTQIIEYQHVLEPSEILTTLDQLVASVLNQSYSTMRDGMDVALCVLDLEQNKVEYAGAKNPLIYIQNGIIKKIKADRLSVGGNLGNKKQVHFTTHTLKIEEPTYFYIYSDGYQDQFGGENDKKYTVKRFMQTINEAAKEPFFMQREVFDQKLQEWKGQDKRQIDDVLVMGFEVNPS